MIKRLDVSATEADGGATELEVRVETSRKALFTAITVAAVCLAGAGIVQVKTGEVGWYVFVIIVAAGVVAVAQQTSSLASDQALAGRLRIEAETRRVTKAAGCTSLPWAVLDVPKRVLLVRRAWMAKEASGVSSRTERRHELLLIPIRDKLHRERVMDELLEWHRHHYRRVHKPVERPAAVIGAQVVAAAVEPHLALVDALQKHLSPLKGVKVFDLTEDV